ncbi:MAG: hypothetical protein KAU14_02985 [Thermoplasmata archaeon]|nr:hypothetical protein [Thermoplasmata archaeon]
MYSINQADIYAVVVSKLCEKGGVFRSPENAKYRPEEVARKTRNIIERLGLKDIVPKT